MFLRGLCLAALLCSAPALAAEPRRTAQADPHAECYCRAQGRMFSMGERACLHSPEGPRIARCVMDLNVTSWRFTQEPCPES